MSNPASMIFVVAAALIDVDGRVLVQQRSADRPMAGLWEFPGGKCEEGERPEDGLVRELEEELGIEVDRAFLKPAVFASEALGDRHMVLLVYLCRNWRGVPRPIDAHALKWVRPAELHALDMPPADKPLVGLLEALI